VSRSLLDIQKRAGDANIGQTLLRLAALAESSHRYRVAQQAQESYRKDKRRVEGLDPRAATPGTIPGPPAHTDVSAARSDHTEVVR